MKETRGIKMKYFVLNPHSKRPGDSYARASRKAMVAYADEIKQTDSQMCEDLIGWVLVEAKAEADLWS